MKPKFLVRKSTARCVSSPAQVEEMLRSGDWLLAAPPPRTETAKTMRVLRAKRRAEGWLSLSLWVDPEQRALIKAAKKPGESVVELFMRLIKQQSSL
jgi:hypothetical protein